MKTILTLLAVAGLSGCAVYPAPGYEPAYGTGPVYGPSYPAYGGGPVYAPPAPPVVIYGSGVYRQGGHPPPPVFVRPPPPRIIMQPGPRPQVLVPRPGHGPGHRGRDSDRDGIPDRVDRDRDGDGVRNRADRDRDGDGVRNRSDRRPNDPRVR